MNKQIKKGVAASYMAIGFQILSVLLYTPFLIRFLGSSDYALYTLVNAFLAYFVFDFGLGSSLAKFLTDCRYKAGCSYREEELLAVICKSFLVLAAVMACAFAVLYQFVGVIFTGLTQAELVRMKEIYKIAAAYSTLAFAAMPLEGIFTANEFFAELKLSALLQKMLGITLAAGALLMGMGVWSVVAAEAISGVLAIAWRIFYLVRKGALKIKIRYWETGLLKQVLGFSVWMAVISFAQRFIIPITPALLGRYADSGEIAVFSVASTLEGYIYTFGSVIGSLFLPQVSRLVNTGRQEEVGVILNKVGRIQLLIVGAVITALADFGKEFIFLWAGSSYGKAYAIVLLIGMPNLIYVTEQIAFSVLTVIGKIRYGAYAYLLSAACNVALSCLLAREFGAVGCGISIGICLWIFNITVMSVVYQKIAGVDIVCLLRECHFKILPYLAGYGIVWMFFNKALPGYSWKALFLKGAAWAVGLAILLWIKALSQDEKGAVLGLWKRIKS